MAADKRTAITDNERLAMQIIQERINSIDANEWFCEQHHWMNWPHDDCIGPGITPGAALIFCAADVDRLRDLLWEIAEWARDEKRSLYDLITGALRSPLGYCGDNSTGEFCDKAHDHGGEWHHNSATGAMWPRVTSAAIVPSHGTEADQ